MDNNQINGQKNNKKAYCPNMFFDNGTVSIGEFKTLDDAMNFPIKEIWCINRTEDNKFQAYQSQGYRLLIICSWNRSIQDTLKFVVAVIHKNKVGKIYYWGMDDLPLYPEEKKNQFEGSLGDDATYTLYQIANNRLNCNTNMKKKLIRLTESDLHRIVKESVKKVLTEEISIQEYGKYFEQISNTLVNIINQHPTLSGISCTKKRGWQWGNYELVIKLPLRSNFNSEENVREGVADLVNYISDSVMCNNWKVWGDFMESLYPSISSKQTITADVKYIKSTKMLKIVVDIPFDVMERLVNKTYPNVQIVNVDIFGDDGID